MVWGPEKRERDSDVAITHSVHAERQLKRSDLHPRHAAVHSGF